MSRLLQNTGRGTGLKIVINKTLMNVSPSLGHPILVQTHEPKDFSQNPTIQFLDNEFTIHPDCFTPLVPGSIVVLDDYTFRKSNSKQEKLDFLKVINYHLRHGSITLILVIHNLYNNNLASEILLAPHLILSYSNLGYTIVR